MDLAPVEGEVVVLRLPSSHHRSWTTLFYWQVLFKSRVAPLLTEPPTLVSLVDLGGDVRGRSLVYLVTLFVRPTSLGYGSRTDLLCLGRSEF